MIVMHDLKVAMCLDHSKDMPTCFNLHQLRLKRMNASRVEVVAPIRRVCSYVSLQK
jgi:hypothetical protein